MLRQIVLFTQAGGEVNVVVAGINVGAQPYWNAEATMLMHTSGILVMTPESAMVLTGKQALDYSGGVSAEDNQGIGGYERVMGPNGQAQYWAPDMAAACQILLRHHDHTYVAPGERFPRRAAHHRLADPGRAHLHPSAGTAVRDGRRGVRRGNQPRAQEALRHPIRHAIGDRPGPSAARAVGRLPRTPRAPWSGTPGIDGWPVCLIGLESHALAPQRVRPCRRTRPVDVRDPLPRSSKKVARAINAASGNRPLVVLANLSGFDGSPESMRRLQLEYGAEIGRAVVNFDGPMVFCVVSRYHGGAFVVFSAALNDNLEVAALEGSYASVIGGAPAAAVVFAREVDARTSADPRSAGLARTDRRRRRRRKDATASRGGGALRRRALREARRGGRRVRPYPQRPAGPGGRFGPPHHSARRPPSLPRRRGAGAASTANSGRLSSCRVSAVHGPPTWW